MNHLLSNDYKEILEAVHSSSGWGITARIEFNNILNFISKNKILNVLDYGSGQQFLEKELPKFVSGIFVQSYEPGIPRLAHKPNPAELVCCIDVLEHVENDFVDSVLDDLKNLIIKFGYITLSTVPAKRVLPNGKNAHLTVMPVEWWSEKIEKRFTVLTSELCTASEGGWKFIVESKK